MTQLRNVNVHDGDGVSLGSVSGALDVHTKDVHTNPVNHYVHFDTGTTTTLNGATLALANQITLLDATSFPVLGVIKINSAVDEFRLHTIVAKVGNIVDLDSPLDSTHADGETVELVEVNMNPASSFAAPKIYSIDPHSSVPHSHIKRILIEIISAVAGDDTKFGGITALTNGVVIRTKVGGVYKTISNWKSNGDMKEDFHDLNYDDRASASGDYAASGRWTFSAMGLSISLDGAAGDEFQIVVQDNLSSLVSFKVKAQGHVDAEA